MRHQAARAGLNKKRTPHNGGEFFLKRQIIEELF